MCLRGLSAKFTVGEMVRGEIVWSEKVALCFFIPSYVVGQLRSIVCCVTSLIAWRKLIKALGLSKPIVSQVFAGISETPYKNL